MQPSSSSVICLFVLLDDLGFVKESYCEQAVPLHRYDRMGKAAVQGEPMMDPSAVFAMLFGRSGNTAHINLAQVCLTRALK